MESQLRTQDWKAVHECLLDLHSAPTLAELPARILQAVRSVVPFDSASLQDDRGGIGRVPWVYEDQPWRPAPAGEVGVRMMTVYDPPFHLMRDAFFAASGERHPHTAYYRRTGDGAARRISEIVPMRNLRRTRFYNEISRRNQLRWQLTFYLPLPPSNTLVFAACRQAFDFTERERMLLEVLRPHVGVAWLRALQGEIQRGELTRLNAAGGSAKWESDPAAAARALCRLKLPPREAEVLFWVSQGKTNAEIATILGLKPSTVKFYVERLLAKLGCETRTAAARTALETLSA